MIYQIVCFLGQEVLYYLVLCTLLFPGYRKYYLTSKMICSTGFLVVVAVMTITSGNTENMLLLLPFFVLCYLGDLFLGIKNRKTTTENHKNKKSLILGTLSFLVAHTYMVVLYYIKSGFTIYDIILPAIAVIFVYFISKRDVYDVGKFLPVALIYAFILTLLAFKTCYFAFLTGEIKDILIAVGVVIFLISDIFVFILYFRRTRAWPIHGLNLATYYLAMLLLGFSIYY